MTACFHRPAPYPLDEARRQEAVDALFNRNAPGYALQSIVDQTAIIFGTRYAAATIIDRERQWVVATTGIPIATTSRAASFCAHAILGEEPLIVADAFEDERFAASPLVRGPMAIRSYAGMRIPVAGVPVGALCALHDQVLPSISNGALAALRQLAYRAGASLASERPNRHVTIMEAVATC